MTDLKTRAKEGYGFLDSYYTAMDVNGDGKVDLSEFTAMAKDLEPPVPEEDAKALFKKADTDGMGFIEPREWVSYKVAGNFTFQVSLDPGIIPTGPRVMMAVEAGLRAALQIMQFDLITITGVEDVTDAGKKETERRLADTTVTTTAGVKVVLLRASFEVLLGTRARQKMMQNQAYSMPNNIFMAAFINSISGGSTTLPSGEVTLAPGHKPGPVTDQELQAYEGVATIIQGHTELLLSHAAAGVHSVQDQETLLRPIFQDAVSTFCKCIINVESVQTSVVQDETGAGLPTNKSMVLSWSSDMKHGGEFQRAVKVNGHQLEASIYGKIKEANLPCMSGVKLDSWTRFSSTYYGSAAASLPRGVQLKQRFGHFQDPVLLGGIRNDTGTPPFVTHP